MIREMKERTDLQSCIKESVWEKAMKEADELLPHFQKLDAGKVGAKEKEENTFGGLKRRKVSATVSVQPSASELEVSTKVLFDYINKGTNSNYRMLVQILSAGGMFYAGQCLDRRGVNRIFLSRINQRFKSVVIPLELFFLRV